MIVIKKLLVNIVTTYLIEWAEGRHEMVMGWIMDGRKVRGRGPHLAILSRGSRVPSYATVCDVPVANIIGVIVTQNCCSDLHHLYQVQPNLYFHNLSKVIIILITTCHNDANTEISLSYRPT